MNLWESIFRDLRTPEATPHTGEAFFVWMYYVAAAEARAIMLVMANHTQDKELLDVIHRMADKMLPDQLERLTQFMSAEGIPAPETTPDPPKADSDHIPAGARITDAQIVRMLVVKIEGLLAMTSAALGICRRTDLGAMFYRFQAQVLEQGYTLRETMLEHGWFPKVPTYTATGR